MALITINTSPSKRELRWFGLMFLAFFAIVGALAWWQFEAPRAAGWILGSAAVVTAIYYAVPMARIPIYLGWLYAAFPIGWTISHLLMAIVYYLVMTPTGLLMRLFRYDPMNRRFDRAAKSYWIDHATATDKRRYFRQF